MYSFYARFDQIDWLGLFFVGLTVGTCLGGLGANAIPCNFLFFNEIDLIVKKEKASLHLCLKCWSLNPLPQVQPVGYLYVLFFFNLTFQLTYFTKEIIVILCNVTQYIITVDCMKYI